MSHINSTEIMAQEMVDLTMPDKQYKNGHFETAKPIFSGTGILSG